jgi:hypothetical protein
MMGSLPLGGKPTVVRAFDEFPETLFFGLEKKALVGSSHTFKVFFSKHEIQIENAHTDKITDI